jgi:hypothetical protein
MKGDHPMMTNFVRCGFYVRKKALAAAQIEKPRLDMTAKASKNMIFLPVYFHHANITCAIGTFLSIFRGVLLILLLPIRNYLLQLR